MGIRAAPRSARNNSQIVPQTLRGPERSDAPLTRPRSERLVVSIRRRRHPAPPCKLVILHRSGGHHLSLSVRLRLLPGALQCSGTVILLRPSMRLGEVGPDQQITSSSSSLCGISLLSEARSPEQPGVMLEERRQVPVIVAGCARAVAARSFSCPLIHRAR